MREVIIGILSTEEIEAEAKFSETENMYRFETLSKYQNMGELIRCKDCKYLDVINSNALYARCEKHGIEFLPFEDDTRECFCSWAEWREE
jgi:cytochrome c-type biogenesis protein CcmH/NrfF